MFVGQAVAAEKEGEGEAEGKAGLPAEVSFRRSNLGNQMKRADALGARFALVLGDAELKSGRAKLKELKTGTEHEVDLDNLTAAVKKLAAP